MKSRGDRGGEGGHGDKAPYGSVLQAIHHSIKELRESIDRGNREGQADREESKSQPSPLANFFQAYLPIIINGLLLSVVISQAVYAGLQWKEMQRAERAWITVSESGFNYFTDQATQTQRVGATIVVKNTGPSPAFKIHELVCVEVRESEPNINDRPTGACRDRDAGMVGTNIPLTLVYPDTTQIVTTDSLLEGLEGKHLYVWGNVMYETFAQDGRHFTTFCLLSGRKDSAMAPCKEGNDAN